ncbi:MAG: hypothetical protein ACP5RT_02775, partial [Candidatus Micrarchaeia archaeon]
VKSLFLYIDVILYYRTLHPQRDLMNFFKYVESASISEKFSGERIMLGMRKSTYLPNFRAHTSLKSIVSISKEVNQGDVILWKNPNKIRYILAYNLTFDIFVSVYGVSTGNGVFTRIALPLSKKEEAYLAKALNNIKEKNVEIRFIGMQSNQNDYREIISMLIKLSKNKGELVEVDLFGNETRHIAIDLKTGLSYDVLLENRIYKPGELINNQNFENFLKGAITLKLK